jgi:hypothetical protein
MLDFQFQSCEEFGVDPLWQPGVNLMPWCPDRKAKVERACDGKDNIPDNPPQEGIQEEQHKIHQIHNRQSEGDLVCAKCITEVLVVTRVNLHAHHSINGFPEGEGQEPIRFGELATKYKEPEKNGEDSCCFVVMEG